MGETTLKTFALHYNILRVVVANLIKGNSKKFNSVPVLMIGILLIPGFASIHQM